MDSLKQRMGQDHYINEQGYYVFTERAHLGRGHCCGSGCLHCPFEPRAQRGARALRDDVQAHLDGNA